MAFAFRLEKVLAVRRLLEESARLRHSRARAELARARGVLEARQRSLHQGLEEFDGLKRRDALTPEALRLHSFHVAGVRRSLEEARDGLDGAQAALDGAEAALRDAHRAREALERLREREESSWRREQGRREARAADELAVSRSGGREEEGQGP